jgi:hypothetical protein
VVLVAEEKLLQGNKHIPLQVHIPSLFLLVLLQFVLFVLVVGVVVINLDSMLAVAEVEDWDGKMIYQLLQGKISL